MDPQGKNGYLNNCFTISSQNLSALKPSWTVPVLVNSVRNQVLNQNNCSAYLNGCRNCGGPQSPTQERSNYLQENDDGWARHPFKHSCYRFREVLGNARQSLLTVFLVYPLLTVAVWGLIYSVFGKEQAFPGGSLFSLFVLIKMAIVLSKIAPVFGCAPAFGMLTAGLLLANVPHFSPARHLSGVLYEPLRALAVVVLLARGALSVNIPAMRRFSGVVPPLGFLPFLAGAAVYSVLALLILEMPVAWATMIGFIVATMSGAIITPCINNIERRIGGGNDVTSVAKAACGLDAIVGICLAMCSLGFIVARGDLSAGLVMGVLEVTVGGAFGFVWGTVVGLVTTKCTSSEARTFVVFAGGAMSMLGLSKVDYGRGGPAGAFVGTLIVAILWRRRHIDGENNAKLQGNFTKLWFVFEPVLFGLIGYRTDLSTIDWSFVLKGAICLAISLTARVTVAALAISCVKWSWRQRLFIVLAWIPKGTVQAALGTVALDTVVGRGLGSVSVELGTKVLHLSVMTAFVASSVGHICLTGFGGKVLKLK